MHVIGTAGHVDHGKSTLVAALTGIHPDRLKEEREREMTIDLGFAWLTLPDGEDLGIVDVPGHRDFIENMLAGVGGIDAALFVVAADEGVMPQTREHLAILDILQVEKGVIALTKIDLIEDPEWLLLVENEIREAFEGSVLEGVPIVRVSAKTDVGMDELKRALVECLAETPSRPDLNRPRLPVDRVFSIAGFGTVVTGTLMDGLFRVGDEIEVLPAELRGRIRGLQTHKKKEETAIPGSRTAVNISGLRIEDIQRGNVIAHPGQYQASRRIDVQFKLRADVTSPLKHNSQVKLFVGASESVARVRVIGVDQLVPGEEGWLQLELIEPIVTVRGDRYILRRPSPGETLGGGAILDPHPKGRHKRFEQQVLDKYLALTHGSAAEVFIQVAQSLGIVPIRDMTKKARLEKTQANEVVAELLEKSELIFLEAGETSPYSDRLAIDAKSWLERTDKAKQTVQNFHHLNPLKHGMAREALRSRIKMQPREYQACLSRWFTQKILIEKDSLLKLPEFEIRFTPQQQAQMDGLLNHFASNPYTPPTVKECLNLVGEDIFTVLLDEGDLVQVSAEVVFRAEELHIMRERVENEIQSNGSITLAQCRDMFDTSRKYAQAFLEYLDASGVTVREGEVRKLRSA
jgi:selenocysteine-specific elongation factor